MPFVIILVLTGLMQAGRSFDSDHPRASAGTALSFGYLLITAFLVGGLFKRIHLPKLTGYIATGIVVGPSVLGLLTERMVDNLQVFTGVAVALIALTAGTELELRAMRPLFRSIGWVTLLGVGGTTILLAVVVYGARSLLPFMQGMPTVDALAVALVLGVVMVAQSPAVVVALRDETDADGPLTRTVLGVVVIADLLVILAFALASSGAKSVLRGSADAGATALMLTWELLGSLVAGLVIGLLLAVFLRKVRSGSALFILMVCFVVAEVGRRLYLDPLLIALSAGVLIRNSTSVGDQLHHAIEASSLPVYVIFFAVAGATIELGVLASVGLPAVLFVVTRAAGFLTGSRLGARIADAPDVVRRYVGFGLLPQAGLALALSMLFAKAFPEFGADAAALTLGVVALNEIITPALYRAVLVRSGEAGARSRADDRSSDQPEILALASTPSPPESLGQRDAEG